MSKKLYSILEITESSSQSEIKKSYRKLAKKYHPDVNMNKSEESEDKFKEINSAYEILGDEKKRREYDKYGDSMFENGNSGIYNTEDIDIEDIIRGMFGDFGNMYEEPEKDINAMLNVDISIIKNGDTMQLDIGEDVYDLKIPKDTKNNHVFKIEGYGNTNSEGKGDLYLHVEISSNEEYHVVGEDVISKINIDLKSILLGKTIEYNYFGNIQKIKIPENIENGKKLRIKKMGLGNEKTKNKGDLYLIVNIIGIPKSKKLSKKLRELIEKEF